MIKKKQQLLGTAMLVAVSAHTDQFDAGGCPYILHPIQVMRTVDSNDIEVKQIAILHDVVEDSEYSIEELRSGGFSERVLSALTLLTRVDGQLYQDYIDGIATNKDAILVKLADLRHNSDISRLKGIRDKDQARIIKYNKAYMQLKAALKAV